jgi:hypothetical protein
VWKTMETFNVRVTEANFDAFLTSLPLIGTLDR